MRQPRIPPRLKALFTLLERADFIADVAPIPITEGGWGRPLRQGMEVDMCYAGEPTLHPVTLTFLTPKSRSVRAGLEIASPMRAKVRFVTQTAHAVHLTHAFVGAKFSCLVGAMPVARGEIIKVTGLSRNRKHFLKELKRSET